MFANQSKKAISLFSGMGGDSYGLEQAGVKVIAYSEKVDIIKQSHDLNFEQCELLGKDVKGDITKIKDDEFRKYENKIFLWPWLHFGWN